MTAPRSLHLLGSGYLLYQCRLQGGYFVSPFRRWKLKFKREEFFKIVLEQTESTGPVV